MGAGKLAVAFFLSILVLLPLQVLPSELPPVKIGVLYPLTGKMSAVGREALRGAQIAADQVNEHGGIWGGRKIVLVTGDAADTTQMLRGYLDDLGLTAYEPSPAVDTNAFVVTPETSQSLGIATLSDLAAKGADLTLGGPPDCETNAFCIPGLQSVYGLDLSGSFTPLDAGSITVQALQAGEIDIALLFSTSGIIADRGWVLLEDDQNMLAADNVVPVLTADVSTKR